MFSQVVESKAPIQCGAMWTHQSFGFADKLALSQSIFMVALVAWSAADVEMELPVLVQSLQTSILYSASPHRDKTFLGVASAALEQVTRKAHMVGQGDGKSVP